MCTTNIQMHYSNSLLVYSTASTCFDVRTLSSESFSVACLVPLRSSCSLLVAYAEKAFMITDYSQSFIEYKQWIERFFSAYTTNKLHELLSVTQQNTEKLSENDVCTSKHVGAME
jgi:hypothetical protein